MFDIKAGLRQYIGLLPFVLTIVVSAIFYIFFTPAQLIDFIGVKNAYVLMMVTSLIGGLTTFNLVPYYSVLFILATSGVNPFYLGLASACGVMMGDSFSYYVGRQGGSMLSARLTKPFRFLNSLTETHPRAFPVLCFLYGSLSPLSNDFITIPAGVAHVPYMRVIGPLALGNIVFNVAFAYGAVYGYDVIRMFLG
jgi:membrane protein DedA with SNARE-associated domain